MSSAINGNDTTSQNIFLKKCTKGTIEIEIGKEFSSITVRAVGELIQEGKGFCLSVNSLEQVEPFIRKLESNEQKQIAAAISEWNNAPIYIEFYEAL